MTRPPGKFGGTLAQHVLMRWMWLVASIGFCSGCVSRQNLFATLHASSFVASPKVVAADGVSTSVVTVRVIAADGTPLPGLTVQLLPLTNTSASLTQPSPTDANGVCHGTVKSTQAGPVRLGAVVEVQSQVLSLKGEADITFVAVSSGTTTGTTGAGTTTTGGSTGGSTTGGATPVPSLATSTLVASPNTQTTDNTSTIALTVVVRDSHGAVVPSVAVTFAGSGGNDVFIPAQGTTDNTGTLTATLSSTLAQVQNVTATFAGLGLTTPVTFTPGAPYSHTSYYSWSPTTTVVADGVSVLNIRSNVRDQQNNPIPGIIVNFTSTTNSNDVFSPAANIPTNASGDAIVTMTSTVAEVKTIHVSETGLGGNFSVTFVAGPAAQANSLLSLNPNVLDINSNVTGTLTVTLRDAFNNVTPGVGVTFGTSGSNVTFTPAISGLSDANGKFTAQVASTAAQTTTLNASWDTSQLLAAVTFFAGSPNATLTRLVVNPNTGLAANGNATARALLTLRDDYGYPLKGQNVVIEAPGVRPGSRLAALVTDANGQASAPVTSNMAGRKLLYAHAGGGVYTASASFTAGASRCTDYPAFNQPPALPGIASPQQLALADLNKDGSLDLVVSEDGNSSVVVAIGNGQGVFSNPQRYPAGSTPSGLSLCDLNQDGNADITVVSQGDGALRTYLGRGNGTFTAAFMYSSGASFGSSTLVCADFNRDGNPDVVLNNNTTVKLLTFFGTGAGTLNAPIVSNLAGSQAIDGGYDLNQDGNNDVVVAGGNQVSVYFGNGGGGFTPAPATTYATAVNALALGDLNLDAFKDLAVVTADQNVHLLKGAAGGGFTEIDVVSAPAGGTPVIVDVNEDGNGDLIVPSASGAIVVALNSGNGTMGLKYSWPSGLGTANVAVADIDDDGHRDIVSSNFTGNNVSAMLNNGGDGTFQDMLRLPSGIQPLAVAATDLNNDGRPDLVVGNASSINIALATSGGSFGTLMSTPWASPISELVTGDFNHDGLQDVAASYGTAGSGGMAVFLNQGAGVLGTPKTIATPDNAYGLVSADFNLDGLIDFATLSGSGNSNQITMALGSASGTYTTATYTVTGCVSGRALASGDVDHDGIDDAVLACNNTPNNVVVVHGGGASYFTGSTAFTSTGPVVGSLSVNLADLNEDGYLDIVTYDRYGSPNGQVSTWINAGGTFSTSTVLNAPTNPLVGRGAIDDLNGDGVPDIVTQDTNEHCAIVFFSTGINTYRPPLYYISGNTPNATAIADFDGNGALDFVTTNQNGNNVTISNYSDCY